MYPIAITAAKHRPKLLKKRKDHSYRVLEAGILYKADEDPLSDYEIREGVNFRNVSKGTLRSI